MAKVILKEESYRITGACFEVYTVMGCGFLESVYQECLQEEMHMRGIPFLSQPKIQLSYKDKILAQSYQPDMVCYGNIILELKAVSHLTPSHRAQIHNYLKATDMPLGLLLNFGHHPKMEWERIAN